MSEDNKAILRRFMDEGFNKGNAAIADELIAPNWVNHDPATPPLPPGPEGIKALFGIYRSAFPDLTFTVDDQIAEGDLVVTRWTARGTHQGELMGIPATGRSGVVTGIEIDRVVNGKIEETWVNWDTMGLLQQLGVIPAPGQAPA